MLSCLFLDSSRGWAAGDSGVIIKTTNGSTNWISQESGISENIHSIFFLNDRLGWALAWKVSNNPNSSFGTILLNTINGGENWNNSFFPEENTFLFNIMFLDSLNGWLCGYPSPIRRTTNGGLNWIRVNIDTTGPSSFPAKHITFYNDKIGFACGGLPEMAGVVYRTTDYGNSWKGYGVAPEPLSRIVIFDSLNIIGIGGGPDEGPSLVTSTNCGNNWKCELLPYWGVPTSLSFRTRNEGWAPLGYFPYFLKTTDGSITWDQVVTPDSSFIFDIIFTDIRNGFCVGDSGAVYKFNYQAVNIKKIEQSIPSNFRLYQNYPNPFNPSTKIKFDIRAEVKGQGSEVKLTIYDILGREINILVNEQLQPGTYEITFDGSNLPSGIYFYKLSAGKYTETRKMLMIK